MKVIAKMQFHFLPQLTYLYLKGFYSVPVNQNTLQAFHWPKTKKEGIVLVWFNGATDVFELKLAEKKVPLSSIKEVFRNIVK